MVFTEGQPSIQDQRYFGDEIERENSFVFPNNGANQMRRQPYFDDGSAMGGMYDETARNLAADLGGQNLSPVVRDRNNP